MSPLHWTPIEYVTNAVGIVLVTNPIWSAPESEWSVHLHIASMILGCILITMNIAFRISDWRERRRRKKEEAANGRKRKIHIAK
jgi:hypothetical protein